MFKPGNKVRRKDGTTFSNNKLVATVERVEGSEKVWLKETGTWSYAYNLELDCSPSEIQSAIKILEKKLSEMKSEIKKLEEAISVLKNLT